MPPADAKNHFGEFVDAARLEPVAVTKYDKPVVVIGRPPSSGPGGMLVQSWPFR
ncbi:MAG: type II toxin-antitoxin system prevent-host-death family antitoxin [Deltaproteobacteria bacterium]|nr:type II toxin-antitoxin system prevent-host-death family antitoxin [Deltaproteobacteria bacterium]